MTEEETLDMLEQKSSEYISGALRLARDNNTPIPSVVYSMSYIIGRLLADTHSNQDARWEAVSGVIDTIKASIELSDGTSEHSKRNFLN